MFTGYLSLSLHVHIDCHRTWQVLSLFYLFSIWFDDLNLTPSPFPFPASPGAGAAFESSSSSSSSPSPSWTTLAYPPMSGLLIKVFQRPFYQNSTHPPNHYWWVTVQVDTFSVGSKSNLFCFCVYFLKVSFENQTLLAFLWWLSFLPGWFYSTLKPAPVEI